MDFDKIWQQTKQIAAKTGKVATAVVTLGGSAAIEKSMAAYEEKLNEHRSSVWSFEGANRNFRESVEKLGTETAKAIDLLKAAQNFVQRLSYDKVSASLPSVPGFRSPDLSGTERIMTDFNAALEAGKGAGLGLAASTGAWVLVAHLGTASTGAAISGLAGAAAHSAILAWFGGGALAAGGGGMALGSLAVGGLAALPLFAYSAYKSYKEASRIDSERSKVEVSISENKQNTVKLAQLQKDVEAVSVEVIALRENFAVEFQKKRSLALNIAHETAKEVNAFAQALVSSANARGASA